MKSATSKFSSKMTNMDLRQIANDIPDYKAFMTMDEVRESSHRLAEDFPDIASIRVVGNTRAGDPIELLTIKGGDLQAFVFGGPHPNEPIGTMSVEYLSRKLCEDPALREELGYTWHFIKSIDSDGMRLNEGWFKGPFTPTNYALHYYRPEPDAQVEWTFPIDYKNLHFHTPLPETEALMRVIDEIKPVFMYSLHNAGFGGVYYYVSRDCPPLYKLFHEIPEWFGLALDLGEPEVSYAPIYAPAVFGMPGMDESYDYLESLGIEDPSIYITAGTSSKSYAEPYNTFTLVVEMPYFDDPRVNEHTVTGVIRRDAILARLDKGDADGAWMATLLEKVKPHLRLNSAVRSAAETFVKLSVDWRSQERLGAQADPDTLRPATVAEVFSNELSNPFYQYLVMGMLSRMLQDEVAAGNTEPALVKAAAEAAARLAQDGAEFESKLNYRALPLQSLVGVQVCAGLATAQYLRDMHTTS